jgi:hypothetical protein
LTKKGIYGTFLSLKYAIVIEGGIGIKGVTMSKQQLAIRSFLSLMLVGGTVLSIISGANLILSPMGGASVAHIFLMWGGVLVGGKSLQMMETHPLS